MTDHFYSTARARRSLLHYGSGKLLAAVTGFSYLLVTVRAMEPHDYGRLVATLALCEIFYLVTGLGLSATAQRYVGEYRLRAVATDFQQFLYGVLRRRLVQSLAFVAIVLLLWSPFMSATGLSLDPAWRAPLALLMVAFCGVAFLEEVMGSLLLQAYSQSLSVARNLMRLAVVTPLVALNATLPFATVVWLEAGVASCSWLLGEWLIRRWARRAPSAPDAVANYRAEAIVRVSLRFYVMQLLSQTYGAGVVKLLTTRLLGAVQTASFGVAQSFADMLRNYMPAHLLATWVRPMMVATWVANRNLGELSTIVNVVLKLNLAGLLPAIAVFVLVGDPLFAWITGGRYPEHGLMLALLTCVVVLQTAHLLLTMVSLTLEQPGVSLAATAAAAGTLPLLLLALLHGGILGAALGLLAGELAWVAVGWMLLRRRGYHLSIDARGAAKIALAALGMSAVGALTLMGSALGPFVAVATMAGVYLSLLVLLKPTTASEIALMRRFVGTRVPVPSPAGT